MKPSQYLKFILTASLMWFSNSFAQQSKIDSLLSLLKTDKDDTTKVNNLVALGWELKYNNPDTAIFLTNNALMILNNIDKLTKKRKQNIYATVYGRLGVYYSIKANYSVAIEYYLKMLEIAKILGDNSKIGAGLSNIGIIYQNQGDYSNALDYYIKGLKIFEEIDDKSSTAALLANIGGIYKDKSDYTKSLDYYFKAMKIAEEIKDNEGIILCLINIGIVYASQSNYPKALEIFFNALKLSEDMGNKYWQAMNLGNIGSVYKDQQNYPHALNYYLKALEIFNELGDEHSIASAFGNIGSLYTKLGKFKYAEEYLIQAVSINSSIGADKELMQVEEFLSQLYDTLNKPQLALIHYKKAMALKDSIFNQEKEKEITRKEMTYEFEKKVTATKAEHEKQIAVAEAEKKKQHIIIYSISGGLLLLLILSGVILKALQSNRRKNKIITEQKQEVERAKHIIEEKHKEQTESINYAKRLQEAILPPMESVKKHLPDSFILYQPKDIVAGDFYWMEVIDNTVFIAAADCTGHGVPGAMISFVCSNALNRAVKELGLRDTGKILDKVTDLVLEAFEKSTTNVQDGMDISLLAYNKTSQQVQWSGANNPLWYISNGILAEIKADKQPIGKHDNRKAFQSHNIEFSKKSIFYLFTDGFADQFGGVKGKKYTYRRLEENLLSNSDLTMEEQHKKLEQVFEEWKGVTEQIDDVTIIGIKLSILDQRTQIL